MRRRTAGGPIATHTGEHHDVDDALLGDLTDEIPPLTVADILRAAPRETRREP